MCMLYDVPVYKVSQGMCQSGNWHRGRDPDPFVEVDYSMDR